MIEICGKLEKLNTYLPTYYYHTVRFTTIYHFNIYIYIYIYIYITSSYTGKILI